MTDDKWGYGSGKGDPWGTAILGSAERSRKLELLWGEHPHSRSDNNLYARDEHGSIYDFDGHRVLIDVVLRSNNYLKESHLSGDEIRRGGSGQIIADGAVIYEFFFRDIQYALLKAHSLVGTLSEHASGWLRKGERDRLVGRLIYYREQPAKIVRLIEDQGCIIIEPDGIDKFPPPVWRDQHDDFGDDDRSIKTEVLDSNIWWFRAALSGTTGGER